ncbi:restriction endonuclease [Spirosoma sp. KCTC 42546]|uniref:restriction endonuclease n=1 Tax=Spirosoma sp. KCTC 42546 TaxID=2520506 RepID=UPI00115BDE4B|nr:restriction endonuclease [Spirosoma sp. KCTC 42546]QDK77768.1 restriction endonuclease [Spirosoma sp. KCTC 42546]
MLDRVQKISQALPKLSSAQLKSIDSLVDQFMRPYIRKEANPQSEIITSGFLEDFGDMLRLHHCFSKGPFSKDKFEYALEEAFKMSGRSSLLAPAGNPTFDLTVDGLKYSLKTEAAKNVNAQKIHISKFMELGKGLWEDKLEHLIGLRQSFLTRLSQCDKILTLRVLRKSPWTYELVEIPVSLLNKASEGNLRMNLESRQMPKPGYCDVYENGYLLFQLYFDGGTERKLQIKNLQKNLCTVHATWEFDITPVLPESEDVQSK